MGPLSRYLGPLVPAEPQLWQDPVPPVDHRLIDEKDVTALKAKVLASDLSISELVHDCLGVGRQPSADRTSVVGQNGRAFASRRKRIGK